MKKSAITTLLLLFAAVSFAAPNLYVSHDRLKKLTVIDTAVNEILQEIPLKFSVTDIKLDADDRYLYLISPDTNALYRIKCKNLTLEADFTNVGYGPVSLAIANDSTKAYVINGKSQNMSIINLSTMEATGDPVNLPAMPKAITISDDDKKVYIAMADMGGVALYDTVKGKLTGVIPAGTDPFSMTTYAGRYLFVSNEGMASVSVIDMKKNQVINEMVTTDMPRGVAAYNNMLYVSVLNGFDIFELRGFTKPYSVGLDYPVYDCEFGRTGAGPKVFCTGYIEGEKSGKVAVIDPDQNESPVEIDVPGAPRMLEIRRIKPPATPTPTGTYTPVPQATATPTETYTKVPTATPVPTDTPRPTPKPTKKPTKRPTPKPTATPTEDPMLRSDLSGRVFMNNNPVGAGVKIKAISKHTDKVYVTKTDEDGRFRFEKLKIGAYVISIEATYIVEKAVAVTVNRGKNPEMKIDVKRR